MVVIMMMMVGVVVGGVVGVDIFEFICVDTADEC